MCQLKIYFTFLLKERSPSMGCRQVVRTYDQTGSVQYCLGEIILRTLDLAQCIQIMTLSIAH